MSHPTIGIFIKKKMTHPVFKDGHYEQAYAEIVEALDRNGAEALLIGDQESYLGNGVFSKAWKPVKTDSKIEYIEHGETKLDLIFDKDFFEDDDTVPVINSKLLKEICQNKHLSYEVLQEFQPRSSVVYDDEEFDRALAGLPGDTVVVKGLLGSSGDAVFVGARSEAKSGVQHVTYPYQVQEFIETSGGIPGVVDGRHDLRLLMMGDEPIIATLRTPPAGGFKSNIGYGGTNRLVGLHELPDELFALAAQVDAVLAQYARYRLYSADFGLTSTGWKLFEVNGWPGVITRERGEELARAYQEKLSKYMIDMYNFYVKINHTKQSQ